MLQERKKEIFNKPDIAKANVQKNQGNHPSTVYWCECVLKVIVSCGLWFGFSFKQSLKRSEMQTPNCELRTELNCRAPNCIYLHWNSQDFSELLWTALNCTELHDTRMNGRLLQHIKIFIQPEMKWNSEMKDSRLCCGKKGRIQLN